MVYKLLFSLQNSFYEMLMITANHLQHLIIINSTMKFVKQHLKSDLLGSVGEEDIAHIERNLQQYKHTLKELKNTTKYVSLGVYPALSEHVTCMFKIVSSFSILAGFI